MDSLSSSVNLEPAWATRILLSKTYVWCLSLAEHRPWDPQRCRPLTQARLHPRRPLGVPFLGHPMAAVTSALPTCWCCVHLSI